MPKNEYIYLKGKAKWFKPRTPNPWGKWSHDLYLDDESLKKFNELKVSTPQVSGIKNVLKKDDDGYYVSLSRPTEKVYNGRKQGMMPPQVMDVDGNPFTEPVGNGSDVTSKIVLYEHKVPVSNTRAKAIRWESTRIDSLVPYDGPRDRTTFEAKQVAGLQEQPPQF